MNKKGERITSALNTSRLKSIIAVERNSDGKLADTHARGKLRGD